MGTCMKIASFNSQFDITIPWPQVPFVKYTIEVTTRIRRLKARGLRIPYRGL